MTCKKKKAIYTHVRVLFTLHAIEFFMYLKDILDSIQRSQVPVAVRQEMCQNLNRLHDSRVKIDAAFGNTEYHWDDRSATLTRMADEAVRDAQELVQATRNQTFTLSRWNETRSVNAIMFPQDQFQTVTDYVEFLVSSRESYKRNFERANNHANQLRERLKSREHELLQVKTWMGKKKREDFQLLYNQNNKRQRHPGCSGEETPVVRNMQRSGEHDKQGVENEEQMFDSEPTGLQKQRLSTLISNAAIKDPDECECQASDAINVLCYLND